MKTSYLTLAAAASIAFSTAAHAIPDLQLDIEDGVYNTTTETVVATSNPFTLYAYLQESKSNAAGDTYGLSMAIVPKTTTDTDYGSFTFTYLGITTEVAVTADMVYGTPPIETISSGVTQLSDSGDLSSHGIFDTYFYEYQFSFDSTLKSGLYDTAVGTGQGPIAVTDAKKTMLYRAFVIDTALLDEDVTLHFDLYNRKICAVDKSSCEVVGDVDETAFAPFSHDAGSGGDGGGDDETVPEPGSLLLIGGGLLGLWASRRKWNAA